MGRPPILRIQASISLTEDAFPGKRIFGSVLRKVVMDDFGVIFTEVFDRMGVNLSC
jgi:hypothetical protein